MYRRPELSSVLITRFKYTANEVAASAVCVLVLGSCVLDVAGQPVVVQQHVLAVAFH